MIRHGEPPYLECSSKGDRRFSAFYARIRAREGRSIEAIYQGSKVFADGRSGLSWEEAKGDYAVNQEDCNRLYAALWEEYINENQYLLEVLVAATGLSDMFALYGHCCQATELWRIRARALEASRLEPRD